MNASGWVFMAGNWLVILVIFIFCLYRALRAKP
jgi:hypothetical protein